MPLALPGIGVSRDIVIGRARILHRDDPEVVPRLLPASEIGAEIARFERALQRARSQLDATRRRIPADAPDEIAAFIDTHLLMLEDTTLSSAPIEIIRSQRCNAEWALKLQQDALEQVFDTMDDAYLKTRRDDVEHVVGRVQRILLGNDGHADLYQPVDGAQVVITDTVSPSDLLILHQQGVAAVVTEGGGPLSHTAILARSLGIPAVMGVLRGYRYVNEGETVVVDGNRGLLLAGLDTECLDYYRRLNAAHVRERAKLRRLKDLPALTLDGVEVTLQANIELPADLTATRRLRMDGVGLFRTEFLYMNRSAPPDETEQYKVYRDVVRRLKGAPVTIRTLDLGQDKTSRAVSQAPTSPLGLRAVRLCLKDLDLFRPQLRAIVRASAHGPVRMLIPMITSVGEAQQVRRLLDETMRDLRAQGVAFDPYLPLGGMIEVPAAALCADALAQVLDFFSIGTNDLIQYTLAADRVDESVNHLYDPLHPAVLRLIRQVIDAGRRHAVPVAMCGEMAGDPQFTRLLLGMGLRDFSMPPAALLEVKAAVAGSHAAHLRRPVERLLDASHSETIADLLERLNRSDFE